MHGNAERAKRNPRLLNNVRALVGMIQQDQCHKPVWGIIPIKQRIAG
jgi:hypothetical protein